MWPSLPCAIHVSARFPAFVALTVPALFLFNPYLSFSINPLSAVKSAQEPHQYAGANGNEESDFSWENIFGMNLSLSMSPVEFYNLTHGKSSRQLSDLLKESELTALDLSDWFQNQRNFTLRPSDLSKDLRDLEETYGPDRLGLYTLRRGFRDSSLYNEVESIICDIATEEGTHFHFLGDSTVESLWGHGLCRLLKDCGRDCSRTTRLDGGTIGNRSSSYYFERAFNATYEDKDYSVPAGVKRAIVIANFDSLHALSLFPVRKFETLPDGRLFFQHFNAFVQYHLDKVSKYQLRHF